MLPLVRVFVSWSGKHSELAANAVARFISRVWSTSVEPFVSTDIEAGSRWQNEIEKELESCKFGVICVTRENHAAPWLNFEAGAIAKRVTDARCVPLALDLAPADIKKPLGMFQGKAADRDGVFALAQSINGALDKEVAPEILSELFEAFWPMLEEDLKQAAVKSKVSRNGSVIRSDRELLEEVVTSVRALAAQTAATEPHPVDEGQVLHRRVQTLLAETEGKSVIVNTDFDPIGRFFRVRTSRPVAVETRRHITAKLEASTYDLTGVSWETM